jgi:hypothetical protein
MSRRRTIAVAGAAIVVIIAIGLVARNQFNVRQNRQIRADEARFRRELFEMLRPAGLTNCQLERFGEPNDGGYLMCANLLGGVGSAYSYGIGGYDKWGCDISTRLKIRVHQYDCFNMTEPSCPTGTPVFHAECVGGVAGIEDGRRFETIENQLNKNGDAAKHLVMKIDVEGAEWDSLLETPDGLLDRIDQMAVEFHWMRDERGGWLHDEKYGKVIERLKTFFYIAHIHFNNAGCTTGLEPFPSYAYEVLFVSRRLAAADSPGRAPGVLHPLDARNDPALRDCQPKR